VSGKLQAPIALPPLKQALETNWINVWKRNPVNDVEDKSIMSLPQIEIPTPIP
jgi:hypothetical protein